MEGTAGSFLLIALMRRFEEIVGRPTRNPPFNNEKKKENHHGA